MSTPGATATTLDDRIARLERNLSETVRTVDERATEVDARIGRLEREMSPDPAERPAAAPPPAAIRPSLLHSPPMTRSAPAATLPVIEWRQSDSTSWSDLVGRRILAWLGGIAVVLGIVLFLALAISHGWIGQTTRVLFAGVASAGLLATGVRLRRSHGRTEAATTMVGAGTAGLFATLIVAGEVYRIAPPVLCVCGSMIVGALATVLAIRWAGQAIGGIGLGGALLAPILVGAPSDVSALAILLVAGASATYVVARQGWHWLGLATVVLCAPQWAVWALARPPILPELVVLGGFAVLGLAGGVLPELRSPGMDHRFSVAIVSLNACLVAIVGYIGIGTSAGHTASVLWLLGLAAIHATAGVTDRFGQTSRLTRQLLLTLAAILADVAFGLAAHGLVLTVGWGVLSVAVARRLRAGGENAHLLELGLGAHITLVLIRVILVAPPDTLVTGGGGPVALLSISTLAASALTSAQLSRRGRPGLQAALSCLGLVAIAYLTAGAVQGDGLVIAWALEGVTLMRIARGHDDLTPRIAGVVFLALAGIHALLAEAPPTALLTGTHDLPSAAVALSAVGGAALAAGRLSNPPAGAVRRTLFAASAITFLYLASVAIVIALEGSTGGPIGAVLDLPIHQQAQVALSALWSLVGLGALTLGLRCRVQPLRTGALVLLLVTVAKVFIYDLSTLDSIYRVISILTLGLLLLVAALTYQRLRPPSDSAGEAHHARARERSQA